MLGDVQQNMNVASQAGSMMGQQNPYGGMQYVQTGIGPNGVPTYTAISSLSPAQQQLLNQQIQTQTMAGANATNLLAGGNYGPGGPTPAEAISGMAGGMTSGMLGNEVNYLQPFFNLQKQQEQAQLANQGFSPGSTAYNNAMMPMMTGQDLTVSNFLAQAYPQAYQMAAGTYQLPMTMAEQMAQWGAPTMPGGQFVQTPQLGTSSLAPFYSAAQGAQEQAYASQLAQQQATMSGLFGLGSAGLTAMALA
jgi:hypothetical protein